MCIALDAMGGDAAPAVPVAGAAEALVDLRPPAGVPGGAGTAASAGGPERIAVRGRRLRIAPRLRVLGVTVVHHGRSPAHAVRNAVGAVGRHVSRHVGADLAVRESA